MISFWSYLNFKWLNYVIVIDLASYIFLPLKRCCALFIINKNFNKHLSQVVLSILCNFSSLPADGDLQFFALVLGLLLFAPGNFSS